MTNTERERKIAALQQRIANSQDPQQARQLFEHLRQLIAQRSPAMVARLERERGLA